MIAETASVNGKVDLSHIELTPEETEEAIYAAKKEKQFRINRAEYAQKLKDDKPALKLNALGMSQYAFKKADYLKVVFKQDEFNEKIFENVCRYFVNDESGEYDLNKGLLIFGHVGCGKTTLMRIMNENPKSSYRIVHCKIIADNFLKAGNDADDVIREYSRPYSNSLHAREFKNGDNMGICFEDLGTEDEVTSFGNKRNVLADLILRCYDNYQLRGRVHITTNLTKDAIKQFYGDRVVSRMQEMFNMVEFPVNTPDYRKQ